MSLMNKRGQQSGIVSKVLLGFIIILVLFIGISAFANRSDGASAIPNAVNQVTDLTTKILVPIFGALLGIENAAGPNAFLIILTFILVSIIVIGTLDTVNLFGETTSQSGVINFAIGIIVAIIGVRYMPGDMWAAMTAPSSAFVATILVGIPFGAMFMISMKVKSTLARKLIWIFYIIFMSWLIFFPEKGAGFGNDFMWIYLIFLVAAGFMMFFDSSVRKFIYKEKSKTQLENMKGKANLVERKKVRSQIKEFSGIAVDTEATQEERDAATEELAKLDKMYKGNLSDI